VPYRDKPYEFLARVVSRCLARELVFSFFGVAL
jgi:hypothetical protein